MGRFNFSARSMPDCESFLTIKWPNEEYQSIDQFIEKHPNPSLDELRLCDFRYRGNDNNFKKCRRNEQRQTTHENKLENGNRYITHTN